MEITDREWCDFVIYTFKGIHVQRIYRNKRFWQNMLTKLKAFSYFLLITSLVENKIIEHSIKWTTLAKLQFFANDLIKDYWYYMGQINRTFYISFFSKFTCDIREITNEDFLTLNGTEWVSNFILDICFNIINSDLNLFNILTCNLSTQILFHGNLSIYLLKKIELYENDLLVMPILINDNHYCLAIADFEKSEFTYLDPFGNEQYSHQSQSTFRNFKNFLMLYKENNKEKSFINLNWTLKYQLQVNQIDSYNCGIYVIYFFEQMTKSQSLQQYVDLDLLRKKLMVLVLSESDNVLYRCIYCGYSENNLEIQNCNSCKRFAHIKDGCSTHDEFIYGMCPLCRLY